MEIQAGQIVEIDGLKSGVGKRLNGQRAAVLQYVTEDKRWQVRIEFEGDSGVTKAIKAENLSPVRRFSLPTGPNRATTSIHDMDNLVPNLCELLLYRKGDFHPSEIFFSGYASMALDRMGLTNFMFFDPIQMENMGGVLALANICREGEEPGTDSVAFGLLEGDKMYVDVLILTLHATPLIIEEERNETDGDVLSRGFYDLPPSQLTPDQDSAPYVRTMSEGPLLLLKRMCDCVIGKALFAAMARSDFYHLLVQRLLRLAAREALGTRDGLRLGKMARSVLSHMFVIPTLLTNPLTKTQADQVMKAASVKLTTPFVTTANAIESLLNV
mmetsp:Transcript_13575/g.28068  ORF Transcript_13575/g.28068 Transcript_13575/m.28068 type:complete len:328 (-) Transcript_13575:984-1967(-)